MIDFWMIFEARKNVLKKTYKFAYNFETYKLAYNFENIFIHNDKIFLISNSELSLLFKYTFPSSKDFFSMYCCISLTEYFVWVNFLKS